MDALTPILCLGLGIALPLLVMFGLLRRGRDQLQVANAYGDVSRRLGLDVDTRGVSLHGHLGDQRIWVGEVMVGHGPERRMMCWGVLDHDKPMCIGLLLRRRGLSDRIWRRAKGPEVRIGDKDLDRLVECHGDEPEQVLAMLSGEVRAHLMRMLKRWRDLEVTDQSVRVYLKQPLANSQDLQQLVDDLKALSNALSQQRNTLAPPAGLEDSRGGWEALAQAHGLEIDAAFPAVFGIIDGHRVRIGPVRTADGYSAELRLVFRPHRTLGLVLRPQVEPDGYWSVGQDIQVGTTAFDDAFVVKGYDPEAVRTLFTEEAQEHLLALHHAGKLDLDDVRLHLGGVRLDFDVLEALLHRALRASAAMGW